MAFVYYYKGPSIMVPGTKIQPPADFDWHTPPEKNMSLSDVIADHEQTKSNLFR